MRNTVEVQLKPGSFGEWFDARSRGEVASLEDMPYLSDLYPTYRQQVRICYLARTYGDGFDPYDAASCEDELRMRRELDAWTYKDEVEDAYWQRWHMLVEQQAGQPESFESCYVPDAYEDNPEVYNFDGWFPWSREQELNRRIYASLPPRLDDKPTSKKRWGTNRKARHVRRDRSPRSKRKRDVCKWSNRSLRCGARRHDNMALVNIAIDGEYVAPMHERVPAGWDA